MFRVILKSPFAVSISRKIQFLSGIPKTTLKSGLFRSCSVGVKTGAIQPAPHHGVTLCIVIFHDSTKVPSVRRGAHYDDAIAHATEDRRSDRVANSMVALDQVM